MTRAAIEQLLMLRTYFNYMARAFDDHVRLTAGTPMLYDIAHELGFQDPTSFGRSFKRWFGMTPGAYRSALNIEWR